MRLGRIKLRDIQAPKRWALNGGPFGSKLVQKDYAETGIPVIRGCNLPVERKFSSDEFVFVSPEKADELLPNNAHSGDLVFTQRGTLGQVGIIPDGLPYSRYVISQSQMKLTVDGDKADANYIYYVFRVPETVQRIHNQAFSSGVPHINLEILRDFEIDLPPLSTQHRIASVLSAYDDLIDNNARRIKILEEMAKMIYREWFVNFRFPSHAKVKMIGSPDGTIKPDGWRLESVGTTSLNFDSKRKPLSSIERAKRRGPYPYYGAARVFDYIDDYIFDGRYLNGTNGTSGLQIDTQRAALVRQAFEWVATRSYSLEEILRRLILLGLTTRRAGRTINRQTLSRMLRNQIYAGWVVSKQNRVKGLHEPIISQELFDAVQDALDGKAPSPVIRKKVNEDFPLRGFVLCTGCGKKLTAGWVKGRAKTYARYWCPNKQCPARVSGSRDQIESAFLGILSMLVPTQAFLNDLPRIAKNHWAHRLDRIRNERKRLSSVLQDVKTLNQKILLQKVNGELSPEDFAMLKETVTQRKVDAESQMAALDSESSSMEALLQEQRNSIIDLVGAWKNGGVQQRQELALNLFPEGLRFSQETLFFEPGNILLMNIMHEMISDILAGKTIGVGDGN